ncbi:MAG: hypothetical protein ACK5X3_23155, partial [Pseudomonadota bacterium]
SYAMPVIAGFFAEGKTWTTYGKFRLGGLSKVFGIIIMIGTVLITIAGHVFVPSAGSFGEEGFVPGLIWYSVGYVVLLAVIWFAIENRRFKGPPIGDEIKRRQNEIAAAERALEKAAH